MKKQLSSEQLADAKKLAEILSSIPEEKRVLVTMAITAFISGMEAQEALMAG